MHCLSAVTGKEMTVPTLAKLSSKNMLVLLIKTIVNLHALISYRP